MKAMRTRTYSATASEAKAGQRWYLIDAEGQVLGRVADTVARLLRGKGKPTFTPHMDGGDYVIVVNADKIVTTGKKETDKVYYRHSGYPGGLKATTLREMRAKHPIRILEAAVKGMLPKTILGERLYMHMKVYAGPTHPHEAQRPVRLELAREGTRRGEIVGRPAALAAAPPAPTPAPAREAPAERANVTTVELAPRTTTVAAPPSETTAVEPAPTETVAAVTPAPATAASTAVTAADLEDERDDDDRA